VLTFGHKPHDGGAQSDRAAKIRHFGTWLTDPTEFHYLAKQEITGRTLRVARSAERTLEDALLNSQGVVSDHGTGRRPGMRSTVWTALGWSHIGCMASTMRPHTRRSESAVSWLE
jgi:hypothetical protein